MPIPAAEALPGSFYLTSKAHRVEILPAVEGVMLVQVRVCADGRLVAIPADTMLTPTGPIASDLVGLSPQRVVPVLGSLSDAELALLPRLDARMWIEHEVGLEVARRATVPPAGDIPWDAPPAVEPPVVAAEPVPAPRRPRRAKRTPEDPPVVREHVRPRGYCRVCCQDLQVRQGGAVRQHFTPDGRLGDDGERVSCPGVGLAALPERPPAPEVTLPVAMGIESMPPIVIEPVVVGGAYEAAALAEALAVPRAAEVPPLAIPPETTWGEWDLPTTPWSTVVGDHFARADRDAEPGEVDPVVACQRALTRLAELVPAILEAERHRATLARHGLPLATVAGAGYKSV